MLWVLIFMIWQLLKTFLQLTPNQETFFIHNAAKKI